MPADSVYEIGRREIRRLDGEMGPLAKGLTGSDDLARSLRLVTTDPRFTFRTESDIIRYAQAAQDRANAAMAVAADIRNDAHCGRGRNAVREC